MSGWQLLPMAVRGSSSRPFFQHPQGPLSSPPQPSPHTPFCHHQAHPRDQIAPLSCLTCLYPANLTFSRWAWRCLLRALKYEWALPALRRLAVSRGGGWVHQAVEQGKACRAVGPYCGRWRRAAPGSVSSPERGSPAPLPAQGKPKGLFILSPVCKLIAPLSSER